MRKIAKKLKNCEECVAKKQVELDRQESMNCLCIKRGILRLSQLLTQIQGLQNKAHSCEVRENFTILKQRAALERPTFSVNFCLF